MISYLIELDKKVPLKELHSKGLITFEVIRDRDIYLQFDIYVKLKKSKTEAIKLTAKEFRICERQAWRIIKKMKDESEGYTYKGRLKDV